MIKRLLLSLTGAALLTPVTTCALGFRIVDQDPFATARGGAFAATADRPSAIYYNPAGIGFLDGQRFHLGAYGVEIRTKADLDSGSTVRNEHEIQVVPQLFYTARLGDSPLTAGIGIYAPFGFGTKYPEDSPFRDLSVKATIKYITINPVVAWQVTETFAIAAGPMINVAQAELTRGILSPGSTFQFEGSGVGYGFNAGLLWKPHPMHAFGVNYRSATSIDFSGHSNARLGDTDRRTIDNANTQIRTANTAIRNIREAVGPFGEAAVQSTLASFGLPSQEIPLINTSFPEEDANAKIHFPQSIVFGYSFRPTPDWNLEFNIDWTDWDSLNTVTLRQQSGAVALPFNYESSFMYEFGATRSFKNGVALSAGYIYSENSIPNESFNPAVPDSNRHIFSAGIGYHGERVNCDLAYQLAYGPSRDIDNGTTGDGTYQTTIHAITLSLGCNF